MIWVLLLVVMFGPRRPVSVCTGDACCTVVAQDPSRAADEPECACCGCCANVHVAAKPRELAAKVEVTTGGRPTGQPPSQRGRTCVDCCVDVSLPIDLTLVPRTVEVPDAGSAAVGVTSIAFLPVIAPTPELRGPFDTGPPRPDPRTSLLATTILRQ